MKALVIEDKEEVVEEISVCLKLSWAQPNIIATAEGGKGIDLVEAESPDIVILGLELPDMDGLKVLKQIRSFSDVPIIVLAAREALPAGVSWKLTYCDFDDNKFFCEWEAPNKETIEQGFKARNMPFDAVYPVRLFNVAKAEFEA